MNRKKALVIPSSGLGDGLIFLSVCYHLARSGYDVTCVHNKLVSLKTWIPSYQLLSQEEWSMPNGGYDVVIINQEDHSKFLKDLMPLLGNIPLYLFSPSSRRKFSSYGPHLVPCQRELPFLENLGLFCEKTFGSLPFEKKTGIEAPFIAPSKQIAIHATASSPSRQWPIDRYIKVYKQLESLGYHPTFVFWDSPGELALAEALSSLEKRIVFSEIKSLILFLQGCSYFIGNDSGIGHLASSLNVPTLTIFNCPRKKIFWRPDYTLNVGIAPSRWIPNFKGFRIRNSAFFWIYPGRVMRKFLKLQEMAKT